MKFAKKGLYQMTSLLSIAFTFLFFTSLHAGTDRITPSELKAMLEKGENITLIDVRTPGEYNEEHIPGAVNIPLDKIPEIKDFPYKGKVVLYCTVGVRSTKAKNILAKNGIKNIPDLDGGINLWLKNGGKTEKPQRTEDVEKKNSDDEIYSNYPDTYIIPKGVCEIGLEPSMVIKK